MSPLEIQIKINSSSSLIHPSLHSPNRELYLFQCFGNLLLGKNKLFIEGIPFNVEKIMASNKLVVNKFAFTLDSIHTKVENVHQIDWNPSPPGAFKLNKYGLVIEYPNYYFNTSSHLWDPTYSLLIIETQHSGKMFNF